MYFSTAYVSGNRTGLIRETELQMGQQFKNHYEETKYKAEVLVQELKDVPYTIIRPGITVGNSKPVRRRNSMDFILSCGF